jgi:hypothetical protein
MDGAHLAAETLIEGLTAGDLSERFLARYHRRWNQQFGRDFFWSRQMARVFARAPFLVDLTAGLMQQRGADYMAEWGRIMTGAAPKSELLRPATLVPLAVEAGRQLFQRYVQGRPPRIEYSVAGVRTTWQPPPEDALFPADLLRPAGQT